MPGIRAGNATGVSRLPLTERIEETASRGVYQWEVALRASVGEELDRTRRDRATRHRFGVLPATIDLTTGELRIAFSDAENLVAKLVELSQAMAHDWTGFMRAVEQ